MSATAEAIAAIQAYLGQLEQAKAAAHAAAFGAVVRKRLETGDWPLWAMQAS